MSEQDTDDSYVRKFGFRRFTGVRKARWYRVMTVAWFNLREAVRRSGFTKLLLVFMLFTILAQDIVIIALSMFSPFIGPGLDVAELFRHSYADSVIGMVSLINRVSVIPPDIFGPFGLMLPLSLTSGGISFMWLLLMAMVGGGLIADDRLHQTTEVYFARISRFEYVIGKLASLILFSVIVVMLPAVVQYFLLNYGLGTDVFASLDLLLWAIGFTLMAAVIVSILTIALSSLTKRRAVATLTLFIAAIIMSSFYTAVALAWNQSESLLILLDFIGALSLMGAVALGYTEVTVNGYNVYFFNEIGVEAIMVVGVVAATLLLGILALVFTLFRRDT
ncbi:MAG: hypothetical protein ACFFD9_02990 [Candidatus Thorarchaeota archaeon]